MTIAGDPLIGLNITGSYVIRHRLAEGGMGAVYIAVNELGNKKVVKVLLPAASQHPQIRERFEREARAAARLKGRPHIVEIDDVGRLANGQQFLTMEYLHGRPLDEHIRRSGRVSAHHAFMIVAQIGRGLHELHSAGIVHRDLKPGNIFLQTDRDDQVFYVKLIDLGIAHDATFVDGSAMRTMTGMAMGTPGYMAPEQYMDAGSVTPTADIYALAIILCELLTGARPWDAPNPSMLFHMQQTAPPSIAHVDMPEAWRPILLAALASDPLNRPQTVYAFLASLASELPGDERLGVQSGAQMLASFARSLLNQAPHDGETVRARGQVPIMWSPPALTPAPLPDLGPNAPLLKPGAAVQSEPATANERPAVRAAPMSTIGGASGVISPRDENRRSNHVRLVLLAVGGIALASISAFGIGHALRSQRSEVVPSREINDEPRVLVGFDAGVDAVTDAALSATLLDASQPATADASEPVGAGTTTPDAGLLVGPPKVNRDTGGSKKARTKPGGATPKSDGAGSAKKFDPDDVEE